MAENMKRTIGSRDLTLLVIGNVIGSGIFLVPSSVMKQSGESLTIALSVWLVGGLLSLMGALSYGELGSMDPEAGGLYAYIRDAFGVFPAFLYGWTLFFVIGAGTVAALAVAAADYMTQFAPMTSLEKSIIAVSLIAFMAVINVRGTKGSTSVQNLTTFVKVLAIIAMSALLIILGHGFEQTTVAPASTSGFSMAGVGLSLISVLWAYEGWQYVTFVAGETRDPQRTLPRALFIGTTLLIVIYIVANIAYVAALGTAGVAASDHVASEAVASLIGPTAGKAIALAIIVSIYGAAHATVITTPRVYFAMAKDGVFFKKLASVHPVFGTPSIAIIASCVWAAILAATGSFNQLLNYVVFIGWMFYALGAAAVIALRIKRPNANRPFKVPGYPVTPALFVLAAVAFVGNYVYTNPTDSAKGIGVVLLGIPAYLIWKRAKPSSQTPT